MFLDGDAVRVGDTVWHITGGHGTVETIEHDEARVRMAHGGVLSMYDGGKAGGRKMFYWYEPVALTPRKGKENIHRHAIRFAETALALWEASDA